MAFSSNSYQYPGFESIHTFFDTVDDFPGPRCGHSLTAVDHRLILFGGITAVGSDGSPVPATSLQGVTNFVYCFNVLNRKWTRVCPDGEPPSPRAGHAAASIGNKVFIQGGIGPAGSSTGDLYILDMTSDKFEWQRVVVQGVVPGPRYGHVMGLADHWLVIFGGKIGNEILADTWALDTTRPFAWERLSPFGNLPSGRMYASASTRDDGYFVLCGGRDCFGVPLGDAYGLQMLSNGRWVWTSFPGLASSQRYQHTAVFVQPRLHVIGGVLSGAHLIDAVSAVAVLDTSSSSGVWLDRNGPGTYNRGNNGQYLTQLMRRCRHAAASVGGRIYVYGGIGGPGEDVLLEDLLVSEDDIFQPSSSMERLVDAPANLPTVDAAFYASVAEGYARLRQRTVVISNERVGSRARQLTLDRFENERRRTNEMMNYSYMPPFTRQKSTQDLLEKVISTLLKPDSWEPPANRNFFLSYPEVEELCHAAVQIFIQEPTVLQLKVPIKVFGDLHGQFGDLMNLFRVYGEPSVKGDIASIDYLFLGDYVDRGKHSLETIILLLALKVKYPENIHLIRGNHESSGTNSVYGFEEECKERMGQEYGVQAWQKINLLFNHLPLAALIEKKIFCVHGGIGRTVHLVEQVANIQRPLQSDCEDGSLVLKDLLWSDPTANDSILGIEGNSRGVGIVSFGPDIVESFCQRNNLDMIIRAHECVMDGFERFAQGRLMTVFSATNYCGHIKNAGAILVIGRDWVIYPKLIHPETPPLSSSEISSDIASMQDPNSEGPSFPVGGRLNPGYERGSTSSQTS